MSKQGIRSDRDVILIFGDWPEPRDYSVAKIGHEIVKRINERGRDVLLLCDVPSYRAPRPRGVHAMWIPGREKYDRRRTIEGRRTFRNLRHLTCADRLGVIGPGPDTLARVRVVFYYFDASSPTTAAPARPAGAMTSSPITSRPDRAAGPWSSAGEPTTSRAASTSSCD